MRQLLILLSLVLVAQFAYADLKPFESDGCSSFPDGTVFEQELWLGCCQVHDLEYWRGGTYKERLASDKALKVCVAKVGQPELAALMLAGVRIGGTPYLPTSFRWGYGWPYPRGYKPLSISEMKEVEARTIEAARK